MNMMALLAEVCAHLGDDRRAAAVYELLLPFERRNVVTAQCCFDGPVSRYLGIAATTAGNWDAAARHFELARSACTRQRARPFLALLGIDEARLLFARNEPADPARAVNLLTEARAIAAELGMERIVERADRVRSALGDVAPDRLEKEQPSAPDAASPATGRMRWEGDVWAFELEGHSIHIRDSKGVRYLAVLLSSPGVEVHALELAGSSPDAGARGRAGAGEGLSALGAGDAGPVLDAEAKAAYRLRLEELREEIEEAESFNDPERAARAREEMDFLAHELTGAVGLGGRDRKAASNAERARVAVTKAVRATLKRIDEIDPDVGQELAATIRTGTFCSYEPDRRRPVVWQVEGE
jgi:hypothetical protein